MLGMSGLKLLGISATLVLLFAGIHERGLLRGVEFYIISILFAYLIFLIVFGLAGAVFTDIFRLFHAEDKLRPYAGEFGSPFAAVIFVFITNFAFHHLNYVHVLYSVFLVYMMAHIFLLFIDRKLTKMAYSWTSLVLTLLIFIIALQRPY